MRIISFHETFHLPFSLPCAQQTVHGLFCCCRLFVPHLNFLFQMKPFSQMGRLHTQSCNRVNVIYPGLQCTMLIVVENDHWMLTSIYLNVLKPEHRVVCGSWKPSVNIPKIKPEPSSTASITTDCHPYRLI